MSVLARTRAVSAIAGVAVAVAVAAATLAIAGRDGADPAPVRPEPAIAEGRVAFAAMGCGSCHALAAAGARGAIGPDLDARLALHTRASLRAAIVGPPPGGPMPEDFGARMTRVELASLVEYLLSTRRRR